VIADGAKPRTADRILEALEGNFRALQEILDRIGKEHPPGIRPPSPARQSIIRRPARFSRPSVAPMKARRTAEGIEQARCRRTTTTPASNDGSSRSRTSGILGSSPAQSEQIHLAIGEAMQRSSGP
jgi:hypothetical protein